MKPNVWIRAGIVFIYGSSIDAIAHQHRALQLVWPKEGTRCSFNDQPITGPLIVDSDVQHRLQMDEGWVLLIEPTSTLGSILIDRLSGQPFHQLQLEIEQLDIDDSAEIMRLISPLFEVLELPIDAIRNNMSQVTDPRIRSVLIELQRSLGFEGVGSSDWRAAEVAASLSLSESRFLHLFSEILGVPWRPYLLWCRMLCAVEAIIGGQSATQAAHHAGFSDSAHLSRTFKKTFGMTIRQASDLFKSLPR
ncbi:helix-turn-helix transcriptional regulator [Vibrio amylolyticus]|uniref:helix-turn-helix transcriptional regulator n=1 Tax=Vibrio amylolyticus TaxID=2847292 RepID=UPI00354B63B0